MYFVDIVVSYDFFVLLCSKLIFFSPSITLYCLPLMLVNKVDQYKDCRLLRSDKFECSPAIISRTISRSSFVRDKSIVADMQLVNDRVARATLSDRRRHDLITAITEQTAAL